MSHASLHEEGQSFLCLTICDSCHRLRAASYSPTASGGITMADNAKNKRQSVLTAFTLILLIVLLVPAAWNLIWGLNYIAVMVLMVLFVITLGYRISGRPAGILINERNLMSLSRFQMVVWTIIILGAFITIAVERIKAKNPDALNIGLDPRLWALMGISTASLIGTPLIQSTKTSKEPDDKVSQKTADQTGETKDNVVNNAHGTLYSNPSIADASFSDIFEGDEIGNTMYVDLSKVQMFFFTIVAALSYVVILYQIVLGTGKDQSTLTGANFDFPVLSQGFIAILGISHAGYLVSKSTDHTPTK